MSRKDDIDLMLDSIQEDYSSLFENGVLSVEESKKEKHLKKLYDVRYKKNQIWK